MTTSDKSAQSLEAAALLTVTTLAWAGNYVLGRAIAGDVPPIGLSTARWLVAGLTLAPWAARHLRADWPAIAANRGILAFLGLTGGAMFATLQYAGLKFTSATNGGLIGATSPMLIALTGATLFGDRLTARQLTGLALSLLGAVVIVARGETANLTHLRFNIGDLMILATLLAWAVYSSALRLKPAMHWTTFASIIFAIAFAANLPLAVGEHLMGYPLSPTPVTLVSIVYTGIVSSVIGYAAWNRGVELIGSQRAGLFLNLIPVFSVGLAWLLLAERLESFHAVAVGLIFTGLWLGSSRSARRSA